MTRLHLCICFTFLALFTEAQDSIVLNTTPKLFGEKVISAGEFEFNASFTPDSRTVFFSKGTTNWDILALFSSSIEKGNWGKPVLLPFSGKYRDADPFVSFDGKKLFFISDRPVNGNPFKNFDYHIFYVDLNNGKVVSEPKLVELPLLNGLSPLYPSVAANGNMYFTATVNGKNNIYVSEWKDGGYQQPQSLSFNTDELHDLDPVVAFDESFLIFSSNNRKGLGGSDLYISYRKNGNWREPLNLGPKVNSRTVEMAPGLSRDNKKLYFTSYREVFDRNTVNEKSITAETLIQLMHSHQNGVGNIYEIDISPIVPKN
jgi:Tol biopolymer transport system component